VLHSFKIAVAPPRAAPRRFAALLAVSPVPGEIKIKTERILNPAKMLDNAGHARYVTMLVIKVSLYAYDVANK